MTYDLEKRRHYMQQYAKWMKMTYHDSDEWGLKSRLLDFELCSVGKNQQIFNLMEWKDPFMEEQIYIFDYAYTRGSGSSKKQFVQTVFHINSKHLGLPEFLMKPETFFHKVGNYLGMQKDINFVEHEKFSDQYLLQSSDEERMRHLMNDKILHFFTVEQNWTLEGIGYYMIFYKTNTLLSPATIEHFHKKGMAIYNSFKGQ